MTIQLGCRRTIILGTTPYYTNTSKAVYKLGETEPYITAGKLVDAKVITDLGGIVYPNMMYLQAFTKEGKRIIKGVARMVGRLAVRNGSSQARKSLSGKDTTHWVGILLAWYIGRPNKPGIKDSLKVAHDWVLEQGYNVAIEEHHSSKYLYMLIWDDS